MTTQRALDQKEGDLKALLDLRNDLAGDMSPLEEITQTNEAVDELRGVLDSIGGDAGGVKDKLGEYTEKLDGVGGSIRDALKDPDVQQLTEGVQSGLGQFTDALDDVDELLEPLDNALDLLQKAVEDSGAPADQQIEALADALAQLVDKLGPLVDRIPGLGAFLDIYARAIRNIAISVGKIQETQAALQKVWETLYPGTKMYWSARSRDEV